MSDQAGFFDVDERLDQLSQAGDRLDRLAAMIDFEMFRPALDRALDRSKGGRPPVDAVLMFKSWCSKRSTGCPMLRRDRGRRPRKPEEGGVPGPRPAQLYALSRFRPGRPAAGPHHDLAVSRDADEGRRTAGLAQGQGTTKGCRRPLDHQEGSHVPGNPNHRLETDEDQDRAGQSGLQHAPADLA